MEREVLFLLVIAGVAVFIMLGIRNLYANIITIFIAFIPFAQLPSMPRTVFGIMGLSPFNIVWGVAFISTLMVLIISKRPLYFKDYFIGPIILLVVLYFVAAFRTVVDLESLEGAHAIAKAGAGKFTYSLSSRLLLDVVKPLQYILAGWIVLVATLLKGRQVVHRALMISMIVLSILATYYFVEGLLDTGSIYKARTNIGRHIGIYANMAARMGVLVFISFLLVRTKASPVLRILTLFATLLIIADSVSRTTMLTLIFILLVFWKYVGTNEKKVLLLSLGLLGILFFSAFSQRMAEGIDQSGDVNVASISSGRTDRIWEPLLPEIQSNLMFGGGLHAIRKSQAAKAGEILSLSPHSSYVELLLDTGLVGIVMFLTMMYWLYRESRSLKNEMYFVILPILIMGITGVTFYPQYLFYLFFIFYGLHRYDVIREKRSILLSDQNSYKVSL